MWFFIHWTYICWLVCTGSEGFRVQYRVISLIYLLCEWKKERKKWKKRQDHLCWLCCIVMVFWMDLGHFGRQTEFVLCVLVLEDLWLFIWGLLIIDHAMCGTCICQIEMVYKNEVRERERYRKDWLPWSGVERKMVFVYIYLLCERGKEINEKQDHLCWWCCIVIVFWIVLGHFGRIKIYTMSTDIGRTMAHC